MMTKLNEASSLDEGEGLFFAWRGAAPRPSGVSGLEFL